MDFLKGISILLILISLIGCAPSAVQPVEQTMQVCTKAVAESPHEDLLIYRNNLVEEYQPVLCQMETATRYQINIQIADSVSDVSGDMEVLYTNNETAALDEIYFRLFPNGGGAYMTISDVVVDGLDVPVVLEHLNTALRVDLPVSLQPGEQVRIRLSFYQTVPWEMGGNYGLYVYRNEILALDQFFPIIPVYDDEGWNVEDPPINADMVYTDEAFFLVTVNAPTTLILAGSGVEIAASIGEERQEVIYAGGPQRDFFLAASTRFESVTRRVGETRVTSYFPEEYRSSGEMVLETAVSALNSYKERFGLYPYKELDLISTPMTAGGMEYSGAVSLSLNYYNSGYRINALLFLESAAAHEVAHQWFFNQVMSDQLDEPWLDEGLVQYATYLYFVDRYGEDNAQVFVNSWADRWQAIEETPIPIGKPAREYSSDEYGPIIYGRAPFFFMALRDQIGETTFDQLLRDYADTYRWSISDTQAFKDLAEHNCACDLTPLFEEWVYD